MSEHTPGPWRVQPHDDAPRAPVDVCGDGWVVCADMRSVEDARLCAAAPDLLAALERIVSIDVFFPDAMKEARAAIAKARGLSGGTETK